jgi:acyl transferase domain-containing protein
MPMTDFEAFPSAADETEPIYIGVNSFGIGGGYAHAALTEYRPSSQGEAKPRPHLPLLSPASSLVRTPMTSSSLPPPLRPHYLLPLSAVSEEHLVAYEASLADYLAAHPEVS